MTADSLDHAVRLFNAGEYLSAHEVLEELWEAGHGPDEGLYKGLIQAAIALHHFQKGNGAGVRKLYRGHRRYLAAYLPRHAGLDLAGFLEEMQRFVSPVLVAKEGAEVAFEFERRPRLAFDADPR